MPKKVFYNIIFFDIFCIKKYYLCQISKIQ